MIKVNDVSRTTDEEFEEIFPTMRRLAGCLNSILNASDIRRGLLQDLVTMLDTEFPEDPEE